MTNREIAYKFGISPAALSFVINHKPGVSEATRNEVISRLQEMGYGHLIKKTASAPSSNLCFIIYKHHGEVLDQHPFFQLLLDNIEEQVQSNGYNLMRSTIDCRKDKAEQFQQLKEMDCSGGIVFATEMSDEDYLDFSDVGFPIVAMDNDFSQLLCNTVSINNEMGTFQAVDYLVGLGHTRIGYLKSRIQIRSFKERHMGYERALHHFGLKFDEPDIFILPYTEEGSYHAMKEILKHGRSLPSALVCDDDTIASGAMRALTEFGYHIPRDISVVGFNDRPTCEVTSPPLSSVNVSKYTFAKEAVDELIRIIKSESKITPEPRSRKIRIGTKLVCRDSAAKPSNYH